MTEPRRLTVEEYEQMSRDARVQLLTERTITDLSKVDQAFFERSKADFRWAMERRQSLKPPDQ